MDRSFEVVVDESEQAQILCHQWLEPVADWLSGAESFNGSGVEKVDQERTVYHIDGQFVYMSFSATQLGNEENPQILYNLCIRVSRPYDGQFYLPTFCTEAENSDDTQDREVEEEKEETGDIAYFVEVWDFFIADGDYLPRKDVSWEYYDEEDKFVGVLSATEAMITEYQLSADGREDEFLKLAERSMYQSFSEEDLGTIGGFLTKFGFSKFPKLSTDT